MIIDFTPKETKRKKKDGEAGCITLGFTANAQKQSSPSIGKATSYYEELDCVNTIDYEKFYAEKEWVLDTCYGDITVKLKKDIISGSIKIEDEIGCYGFSFMHYPPKVSDLPELINKAIKDYIENAENFYE